MDCWKLDMLAFAISFGVVLVLAVLYARRTARQADAEHGTIQCGYSDLRALVRAIKEGPAELPLERVEKTCQSAIQVGQFLAEVSRFLLLRQ